MADKKISALTNASTPLTGTELIPLVQGGATVKATPANIAGSGNYAGSFTTIDASQRIAKNNTAATASQFFSVGGSTTAQTYANITNTGAALSFGIESSGGGTLFSGASAYATVFGTTNATSFQIATNNIIRYDFDSTGNLIVKTAAKGVNFTANTPAAGMTSQLLNWYEEGTWTPTIAGSGTSGTGTYTTQIGRYTRIGRTVHIQMTLTWTNLTGASGILVINGLPITSANISGLATPVTTIADSVALTAGYFMQNFVFANSTQIAVRQFTSGNATAAAVGLATSGTIYVSGSYIV